MLKNRERVTTSIDKSLLKKLRDLSDNTKVPMSKLIDEAIEDLVDKRGKK